MKLTLVPIAVMACLLSSCGGSSTPEDTKVIIEASDYKPIGEGLKFLSLALLGSSVVWSVAFIVNGKGGDHD